MSSNHFTLFADYFQFYLQDESADGNLSESWNEEAVTRLLAVAPGTVGVGTVRNMDVPVSIEVLDSAPPLELEQSDHVVECTILVQGSRIVVAGCTDYFPDAARIEVAPGTYRVRVGYEGLASISEDGLSGNDSYKLQLWQAAAIEPRVLKQRAG
jgi:hypothetical protein